MNIEQNIHVYPATQRQPSAIGAIVTLVLALALVAAVVIGGLWLASAGVVAVASMAIALGGLLSRLWSGGFEVIAGSWPLLSILGNVLFGTVIPFVFVAVAGLYAIHGIGEWIAYKKVEQAHRHLLERERVTVVERVNWQLAARPAIYQLPVIEREFVDCEFQEADHARCDR